MFEDDVKSYYDTLVPSNQAETALLIKLKAERRKKAKISLLWQSAGSLAASFLLALTLNYVGTAGGTTKTDLTVGSVMTQPSGYVIGGIVLAILLAAFVALYTKKQRKNDNR